MNYLYDDKLKFGSGVSLAADSTSDPLDLGPNIGSVERVDIRLGVETWDHTGAGTLTVNVQDSADGTSGWATIGTSGALTFNALEAGDIVDIPFPTSNKPYVRLIYDVSTALTGTVNAVAAPFATRPV